MLKFNFLKTVLFVSAFTLIASCSKKDDTPKVDKIPYSGTYEWAFEIPGWGTQKSIHVFYPDSVQYKMEGTVYVNQYTQTLEKYFPDENRLVTIGSGGTPDKTGKYFVMFFKEASDTSVTIYKKECSDLEEAQTFPVPDANATTDHGWNEYIKK